MTIISTCPSCGAPIYGKARIKGGEELIIRPSVVPYDPWTPTWAPYVSSGQTTVREDPAYTIVLNGRSS